MSGVNARGAYAADSGQGSSQEPLRWGLDDGVSLDLRLRTCTARSNRGATANLAPRHVSSWLRGLDGSVLSMSWPPQRIEDIDEVASGLRLELA